MARVQVFVSAMALVIGMTGAVAADLRAPPAKIVLDQSRYDVAADGSATITTHLEIQVLDSNYIQQLAQQPYSYSELTQELEINEAYTLKKDGTKIPVAPSAIITQQRPGTTSAPMFTDQKQKVIIFPYVEAGDTLVNTRTLKLKPRIPQLFATAIPFTGSLEVVKAELTFATPKALPLYFDAKGVAVSTATDGDKLVYTIPYANPTPVPMTTAYVSLFDRSSRVFVSSMRNFDQFAKVYGGLLWPKILVTPKIQAKADEITAGVTDRREQVRKIYEWVATHVRYVALEFGQGGYLPHDPEEILLNAYGDCKDHSVLFISLMKAKGIGAEPILINATDGYTVPTVAMPAFNHMIAYIPELSIYADTTQHSMSLGYLTPSEYGKTVLHVRSSGKVVRTIPVLSEKDSTFNYTEHQKVDAEGQLTGEGKLTASGVAAGIVRRFITSVQSAGPEKVATEALSRRGLSSATGMFEVVAPELLTPDYGVNTHYKADKQNKLLSGESFAVPQGLALEGLGESDWLGPLSAERYKKTDVVACYSNRGSEDYTLEFPVGKRLAAIPADTVIDTRAIKYKSHWSVNGHAVSVHRELTAHFDEPLCRGSERTAILAAVEKIRADAKTKISLVADQGS